MFASNGEITAPCGVPVSAISILLSSSTPAFSHLRIRRMTRWSPIRCSTNWVNPLAYRVEESRNVSVQYPVHLSAPDPDREGVQRIVLAASRPEGVREPEEVFLVDRVEQFGECALDDLVFQHDNAERAAPSVRFGMHTRRDGCAR